ncbi:repressor of RNA polymerase III transcription MAF1, putative [Plasmodium relictum]|uniref:Repressor of RNA polymerase III transcription MAF1, putative n=1 Tax=Plasmodium relictum TaxID=85471 RepID=A0A1J1H210_PLARL|nr:repressor of RNA polymerase III transcription MAF1, putative [Plasmodium relictum]CRG98960.1 repressor of RNA polymerase III transcription MAF1, putative [Plasmodium relictum]
MINLDIENLNDVNLILERLEAHDRFIEAKIELFEEIDKIKNNNNTNRKNINKKKIPEIINKKEKKSILSNIINILNYVFPDYEFKYLNNSNYKYIKNINSVIDNINYNLFYIIENIYRGFNKKIWKILKELIDFKYCDVYTYLNDTDNDPYVDKESISSFNYFFFAKKNKRILFISCITKPKYKNHNDEDFNNIYMGIQDEPSINEQNEYYDEDSSFY